MSDCCIFAGQGAQVPGMGKDFAEADAEAKNGVSHRARAIRALLEKLEAGA